MREEQRRCTGEEWRRHREKHLCKPPPVRNMDVTRSDDTRHAFIICPASHLLMVSNLIIQDDSVGLLWGQPGQAHGARRRPHQVDSRYWGRCYERGNNS